MDEPSPSQTPAETYVGQPVERFEDAALLTGRARYADDIPVPQGTLHAAIVRSPHASARIVNVDASQALAMAGVTAVLTGDDIRSHSDPFLVVVKQPIDQWSLAVERTRYVGEPVCVVVADDRYIAEDAAELVIIDYAPEKPVIRPGDAVAEGAALVHEAMGSNLVSDREFTYGDPDQAFADADSTVALEISYPRNSLTPMECFVVVAEYLVDEDSFDVMSHFQGPFTTHPVMARALRVPGPRFRLRTPPNSGGSFGVKQSVFPYIVLMSVASKIIGRPVKWVEDRLEHLVAANSAPNRDIRIEAAVKSDGTVLALRIEQLDDYGAFLRSPMPGPLYRMHGSMTGAYDVANIKITNKLILTNKAPAGLVRGFGGPQIYYGLERLMQRVAVELDLDPLEVITRNLIPAGSFPYKAAAGGLYDSGDYPEAVARAVDEGGLEALKQRRDAARKDGKIYGIGYAAIVEPGMSNMGYLSAILPAEERARIGHKDGAVSMATVAVDPLGAVSVTSDTTPQGQGHMTVLAQIVADRLGLRPSDIKVNTELDTQKDAWSIAAGTYSCRFSPGTAVASQLAANKVRDKLATIASQYLNASPENIEFAKGTLFDRNNPENSLKFGRVAGAVHWAPNSLPQDMEHGIRETGVWSPPELSAPDDQDRVNTSLTYGFVFDYCGIEIDPVTAQVRIDKYVTMHDAGTLLNPLIAKGQILGSFVQGLGAALYEEFVYGEDGSFLTGTFADYLVPTANETPSPVILHMESPSPFTPLGAKGLAEGNCMSTPVCIANAVADALGVRDITLPLTPTRIGEMLFGDEPPAPEITPESTETPQVRSTGRGHELSGKGSVLVPAASQDVWRVILDAERLAAIIPGCRRLEMISDNHYIADITLGIGPVRGRFAASVEFADLAPPQSLTLKGKLSGPLGSSAGQGQVQLAEVEGGCEVTYDYGLTITGKVAAVGGRMLDGAARALIAEFFVALVAEFGGAPAELTWWRRILHAIGVLR